MLNIHSINKTVLSIVVYLIFLSGYIFTGIFMYLLALAHYFHVQDVIHTFHLSSYYI